ncbi:MAG TPA: hypothetical protein VMA83_02805 [Solirubrobacteraceae bacterium]|nr:hypothetical protein [Solirubrobacteraceae bacterium]
MSLIGAAALIAGCGSSSTTTTTATTSAEKTSTSASSSSTATAPLKLATVSGLSGKVVVDSQGRTLYLLKPETTTHLLCTESACLAAWPAVTVTSAAALTKGSEGITGRLGVVKRPNGEFQVTLDGHPLYVYAGDAQNGQANGEDLKSFGGTWEAVTAAGEPAASESSGSTGGY